MAFESIRLRGIKQNVPTVVKAYLTFKNPQKATIKILLKIQIIIPRAASFN